MDSAWQILRDAGLPLAMPRTGQRRSPAELAVAVTAAISGTPSGRDAEALAAFVLAWSAHWPTAFAHALGRDGDRVVGWARGHVSDEGRYLKLRRIALENLADVL